MGLNLHVIFSVCVFKHPTHDLQLSEWVLLSLWCVVKQPWHLHTSHQHGHSHPHLPAFSSSPQLQSSQYSQYSKKKKKLLRTPNPPQSVCQSAASTIVLATKKSRITGLTDFWPAVLTSVVLKSFECLVLSYIKTIRGPSWTSCSLPTEPTVL